MNKPVLRRNAAMVVILALVLAIPIASAQKVDWPNKPVRFVVPFPPGGSNDQLARLLGARLAEISRSYLCFVRFDLPNKEFDRQFNAHYDAHIQELADKPGYSTAWRT